LGDPFEQLIADGIPEGIVVDIFESVQIEEPMDVGGPSDSRALGNPHG
jgi:hypothetical protein